MNSASAHTRFEALVQTWSADLYRYAYWLCRSPMQAEELVQETFLRAWRSLHSLRHERAAKSWLITILRREHARTYRRGALAIDEGADPDEFGASGSELGPEGVLLHRALRKMSERYREPLLLQVLGGYSTHEIGEALGISKEAVLSRLFRARRKLRATLEGSEDDRVEQEMNL